jgi:hypothetical protein
LAGLAEKLKFDKKGKLLTKQTTKKPTKRVTIALRAIAEGGAKGGSSGDESNAEGDLSTSRMQRLLILVSWREGDDHLGANPYAALRPKSKSKKQEEGN